MARLSAPMLVPMLALATLAVGLAPAAARADDIGAAARGVVRVVTIAVVDGQVVGFGHGSGIAIGRNRIVTNAHVVDLAQRYSADVVIGVVPSQGAKSYRGRLVAYDARRDLALVEFGGTSLPPATLYTGPSSEGEAVVALGFPGNVDLATARSAADYITPTAPVRSEGVLSGRRQLTGTQVLLHTASIARGSSGGPLLDRCGRVIGVNSAITRGEEGDSTFGFAIADSELAGFLRDARQPYASVGSPCTSIEERLRTDSDAEARAAASAAAARREAATDAGIAREERLARLRERAQRGRENVMAVAVLLLVGGALALGAAGLFASTGRRRATGRAAAGGALGVAAAVLVFVVRPSAEVVLLPASAPAAVAAQDKATGALTCAIVPERSRIVTSSTAPVALSWAANGCVDRHEPFQQVAGRWERLEVPDDEQTVTLRSFDPATRTYAATRWFLDSDAMATARQLRGADTTSCGVDPAAVARQAAAAAAIRAQLPPLPNEKLVYACTHAR